MPAQLRMGNLPIDRLLFDKPIEDLEYAYDFRNWIFNPNQPSDGFIIEENKITVTKFKPNVWFLKSNYSESVDSTSFLNLFYNKVFILKNFNNNPGFADWYTYTADGQRYAKGFMLAPFVVENQARPSSIAEENLHCIYWPWDMGIPSGAFKSSDLPYGAAQCGYFEDTKRALYNAQAYCVDGGTLAPENQIAFALYTGVSTDEDGYIELETPVIIEIPNTSTVPVKLSTLEGFKVFLNNVQLFNKEKTIDNIWTKYGLLVKTTWASIPNWGQDSISWYRDYNESHGLNANEVYRLIRPNYVDNYHLVDYEIPTDLEDLIEAGFPIIFNLYHDVQETNQFWSLIADIFDRITITDGAYLTNLFRNSNIPSITIHFAPTHCRGMSNYTKGWLDNAFVDSSIKELTIIKSNESDVELLHNAFQCPNLTSFELRCEDPDEIWYASELSGAFSHIGVSSLPDKLRFHDAQPLNDNNEIGVNLQYAFEYSKLTTIGHNEYITICQAKQAFFDSSLLTTINLILDFKWLNPNNDSDSFQILTGWNNIIDPTHPEYQRLVHPLVNCRIKNLNKGDWHLDGTVNSSNFTHANIPNLNADSIEYLLTNVYNLTYNNTQLGKKDRFSNIPAFDNSNWIYDYQYVTLDSNTKHVTCINGAELVINNYNGELLKLNVGTLTGNDYVTVELYDVNNQLIETNTINLGGMYFYNVIGKVVIKTVLDVGNTVELFIITTYSSEASAVTNANIYCPSNWTTTLDSTRLNAAVAIANNKGWTIYIGGTEYIVT